MAPTSHFYGSAIHFATRVRQSRGERAPIACTTTMPKAKSAINISDPLACIKNGFYFVEVPSGIKPYLLLNDVTLTNNQLGTRISKVTTDKIAIIFFQFPVVYSVGGVS